MYFILFSVSLRKTLQPMRNLAFFEKKNRKFKVSEKTEAFTEGTRKNIYYYFFLHLLLHAPKYYELMLF